MTRKQKQCIVMADKISLTQGFSYDPMTDTIVGFVDHGEGGRENAVAQNAQVFEARGLYDDWKLSLTFYLTGKDVIGKKLSDITRSMLEAVINTGFDVRALVVDGALKNINMFRRLGCRPGEPVFTLLEKKIVAIIDPPHLIKAIRNNLLKYDVKSGEKTATSHGAT